MENSRTSSLSVVAPSSSKRPVPAHCPLEEQTAPAAAVQAENQSSVLVDIVANECIQRKEVEGLVPSTSSPPDVNKSNNAEQLPTDGLVAIGCMSILHKISCICGTSIYGHASSHFFPSTRCRHSTSTKRTN